MDGSNTRKIEIENMLKNEHGRRESFAADLLKNTRDAEGYLKRIDFEDKRYFEITQAMRKYFEKIDQFNLGD